SSRPSRGRRIALPLALAAIRPLEVVCSSFFITRVSWIDMPRAAAMRGCSDPLQHDDRLVVHRRAVLPVSADQAVEVLNYLRRSAAALGEGQTESGFGEHVVAPVPSFSDAIRVEEDAVALVELKRGLCKGGSMIDPQRKA